MLPCPFTALGHRWPAAVSQHVGAVLPRSQCHSVSIPQSPVTHVPMLSPASGWGHGPIAPTWALGRAEPGELRCLHCQSRTPVLGVEAFSPGTGAPTGFGTGHQVPTAVADPSLPASLSLALFLQSFPPLPLCFPCAACSSQGLSKGHRCGSALSKRLVLWAAASSVFPGRGVYVLLDASCAEQRSLPAMPAADSQQVSECPCMSPACKHCSKCGPRESRLGMTLARCCWEAGCLLLKAGIHPRRPHQCCLNSVRKSDVCVLHQLTAP